MAARFGARVSRGAFPLHGAATIGGLSTLRGYRWQRFSGDEAYYGALELRVPLMRANLLVVRGRLGVIGFVDAGRVRFRDRSPGGWHTGRGGGLMLETLGTVAWAAWARGEEDRFYVGLGFPF